MTAGGGGEGGGEFNSGSPKISESSESEIVKISHHEEIEEYEQKFCAS